jgi:hypothetical protein
VSTACETRRQLPSKAYPNQSRVALPTCTRTAQLNPLRPPTAVDIYLSYPKTVYYVQTAASKRSDARPEVLDVPTVTRHSSKGNTLGPIAVTFDYSIEMLTVAGKSARNSTDSMFTTVLTQRRQQHGSTLKAHLSAKFIKQTIA